jgi:putative membrane protein
VKKSVLLIVRWAISAGAVAVAAWIVPGITVAGHHRTWTVIFVALVLGLVNAFIRPIVAGLSCGLIVLTLGLFTLVINGLMLWLASWISANWLSLGFHVKGFWSALLGALVISVFSFLVSTFVGTRKRRRGTRTR